MRWFTWFKPRRLDDGDFQAEIESHLQMAAEEHVAGGTDRESARSASLKEFGNITKTVEAARSVWTPWWAHALHDWMNDIYPLWVRAHGIMLITPVNWYSPSSPMKLMMDRLVCADGGNPDPSSTDGKDAKKAKQLELDGWPYPRHLKGRIFSVIVHGDVEGAENVRRSLADWLRFMELKPAGPSAELDRYIGYWQPYSTSHDALDRDRCIQEEVRNAAHTLLAAVQEQRAGRLIDAGEGLDRPRQK